MQDKESVSKSLVVNLFGQPGCGKSTGATYLFYHLKFLGVNCEYVSEFAKDKVWEENKTVFEDQNYIFGKQSFKLSRVDGKVDVIITDSPLLLCAYYSNDHCAYERTQLVLKTHHQYNNLNFYINRVKPYNPAGRHQTEEESDKIAKDLEKFLRDFNIKPHRISGDQGGYDLALSIIKARLDLK
mgnify:CR=1 FL=1